MVPNILNWFNPTINTRSSSKYVIVLGCDGMGQIYLESFLDSLPNIKKLIDNGASTQSPFRTRCRMPSISAPNWSTIITGLAPEESGIIDNNWTPDDTTPTTLSDMRMPPINGVGKIPESIWTVAHQQDPDINIGVVVSWSWISHLVDDSVDILIDANENDKLVMSSVEDMITEQELPNLLFIHLDGVDKAGHKYGWGSTQYFKAIMVIDNFIGKILDLLPKNNYNDFNIVLTADHGGWQHSHEFFNQDCLYIPLIFYGKNIKKGYKIPYYVNNTNIAPTVLSLLGLEKGKFMCSEPIKDIINNENI